MSFSLYIVIAEGASRKRRQPKATAAYAHSAMHEQTWALGLHSCRALSSQLRSEFSRNPEATKTETTTMNRTPKVLPMY